MINIDIKKFIKDRLWLGWYWTGTLFPDSDMYWCKLAYPKYHWSIGMDIRKFKAW